MKQHEIFLVSAVRRWLLEDMRPMIKGRGGKEGREVVCESCQGVWTVW